MLQPYFLIMKVKDLYNKYIDISCKDIEYLLRYKYQIDMYSIIFDEDIEIDWKEFENDILRLKQNEPGQYIVGSQDFMGLPFNVGKGVLIPRPETEILVNLLSDENIANKKVLDLCSGSGAIGISISKLYKANVTCTDISEVALKYISENANLNDVEVKVLQSDLFENIVGRYDFIISNPPYIPTNEIDKLESNVKNHEPILALDGGEDGLDFYKKIISEAPKFLEEDGKIYLEIGHNQGEDIKKLLNDNFDDIKIIKDYNDFDRIAIATLRRENV